MLYNFVNIYLNNSILKIPWQRNSKIPNSTVIESHLIDTLFPLLYSYVLLFINAPILSLLGRELTFHFVEIHSAFCFYLQNDF